MQASGGEPQRPVGESLRKIRRSRDDRVIAGVAGGIGHHLGVDPLLIRIAFVVLTLSGGSGILLYVLGWIFIPEERTPGEVTAAPPERAGAVAVIVGTALIALGSLLLLSRIFPDFNRIVGPIVLIAIGVGVVVTASRR
ncbi:MAG TPA: PspC domain-containing protein [Actinomycetota bacterium]|nr:PspC domain-containing protein [Actinomycetota bacterium]